MHFKGLQVLQKRGFCKNISKDFRESREVDSYRVFQRTSVAPEKLIHKKYFLKNSRRIKNGFLENVSGDFNEN